MRTMYGDTATTRRMMAKAINSLPGPVGRTRIARTVARALRDGGDAATLGLFANRATGYGFALFNAGLDGHGDWNRRDAFAWFAVSHAATVAAGWTDGDAFRFGQAAIACDRHARNAAGIGEAGPV